MQPYDLIAKKRDGGTHTFAELQRLVQAVVQGDMPDYQAAAWLMAAYLRGLDPDETLALTLAMRDSGQRVSMDAMPGVKLDKHSSGGVGDKLTFIVVPLLAAAGVPMLKMSGRGLGHTGGTIDKLEAIAGMRTDLTIEAALAQVRDVGAALVGQSPALVPADKKLYALRDVTATVDSIPLIAASIMSKKLAGGADAVLLDVKVGSGAFMKDLQRARALAQQMVAIGVGAGVRTRAVLTAMDQPLGRAVGNALEVAEACAVLNNLPDVEPNLLTLSVELCAHGLVLARKATDLAEGRAVTQRLIADGSGARKFAQIISAQGGAGAIVTYPDGMPSAPHVVPVICHRAGWVQAIDAESVGRVAMRLGAGRIRKEDLIDPAVGIVLRRKVGDPVGADEVIAELHASSLVDVQAEIPSLLSAYRIGDHPSVAGEIILDIVE